MERLQKDLILEFNPDTLEFMRKKFGFNNKQQLDDAIDLLDQWIKKQKHFVKHDYDRGYLERLIITNKGSTEKAKERLDKLCTSRTLMPHFFQDFDIRNDFKPMLDKISIVILPKLTSDHCRVIVTQTRGSQYYSSIFKYMFNTFIVMAEYMKAHDYSNGFLAISDLRDVNLLDAVTHISATDLRQCFSVMIGGYGTSVKAVHFITTSNAIDILLNLMKQVVSEKIGKRLHVHKTIDSVYEHVNKHILPKDFGGKDEPLADIQDKWVDILSSTTFREYRKMMNQACTDETCRDKDKFNEEYLGIPGSFRSLVVD